ncbi:MAG TPA: DUF3046 domain-containing protein [Actinomycetes bacterium]|nr:DUF3046 domain-containing protein [Actinomycetes bacterium]
MRLSDFWVRMEHHLGPAYARTWAHDIVLAELDNRTVDQALAGGVATKDVWRAVAAHLELPARER